MNITVYESFYKINVNIWFNKKNRDFLTSNESGKEKDEINFVLSFSFRFNSMSISLNSNSSHKDTDFVTF